jgi:hypothetical protein
MKIRIIRKLSENHIRQHLIKFMLTFKLNNEPTNIQQTICYVRKISDFSVAQIIIQTRSKNIHIITAKIL